VRTFIDRDLSWEKEGVLGSTKGPFGRGCCYDLARVGSITITLDSCSHAR